ncbi:mitochondrial 50S ribosomal protein L3 [Epithele typhae]|uniref:mitochondrial 50S ribosomal protein L3 n=1 Tax=Epithele typhae TaxID=378194 RepID=UPI0020079EB3|nr:mitochondrial 50S ribosomal protein L3 [Epithele typhae]KAH9945902.1 mitochondrial 50S ribosomal protein L3 [Epithele typhae]
MPTFWSSVTRAALPRCRRLHSTAVADATAAATEAESTAANKQWTPFSIRTGLIARKRGMTVMYDETFGTRFPVTVLQVEQCQVTKNVHFVRPDSTEYHAVQVAATDMRPKNATKQMLGHFEKAGVNPKRIVKEFPVTADAHVPEGTTFSAVHFVPGQFVDVIAKSIGKGFQGTMKRWNFKGLRASHGVSVSHRSAGAIGAHQDPGRVWPGKKMAGRMGDKRITTQNLAVVRVDTDLDLIYVRGAVPGVDDAQVMVRDAKKKMNQLSRHAAQKDETDKVLPKGLVTLPFPAGTKEMAKTLPSIIAAPSMRVTDPFIPRD